MVDPVGRSTSEAQFSGTRALCVFLSDLFVREEVSSMGVVAQSDDVLVGNI